MEKNYVGRGALKLKHAIGHFKVKVADKIAADLGASTGGFTEVLLENKAAKVYAVDTAYGQLDWKLRQDGRVVAKERINALHVVLDELVDIVTVDVGWTPQRLIIPQALKLLKSGGTIISLLKPHYEAKYYGIRFKGKTSEAEAEIIREKVIEDLSISLKLDIKWTLSPITGGKGQNIEYLLLIENNG